MPATLPRKPSLTQLKKQAKELLKAHREADISVCETLRLTRRFAESTDREILQARITLHDTQFALALSYGFRDWKELKTRTETVQSVRRTQEGTNLNRGIGEASRIAGPATTLVVEDEEVTMDVMRVLLTKLGYHILEARNREEAIQIAPPDRQIDLVLLDVKFLAGTYRNLIGAQPGMKTIACSGLSIDDDHLVQGSLDIGRGSFLLKPFGLADLSAKLNKVRIPPAAPRSIKTVTAADPASKAALHRQLAILYASTNRMEEARAEATRLLGYDPAFTVEGWGKDYSRYRGQEVAERDMAVLREAGLK